MKQALERPYFWVLARKSLESGNPWTALEYQIITGMSEKDFELLLAGKLYYFELGD